MKCRRLSGDRTVSVAVKLIRTNFKDGMDAFINEAKKMFLYRHPNVLGLIGICTEVTPFGIVSEFMDQGDLLTYLRRRTRTPSPPHYLSSHPPLHHHHHHQGPPTNDQLQDIVRQVACGMSYLAGMGHIHCDLVARNCLVGHKWQILT